MACKLITFHYASPLVITAQHCHFLHYVYKVLEKLQHQVASVDLTYVSRPIEYIQASNILYNLKELLKSQNVSSAPLPSRYLVMVIPPNKGGFSHSLSPILPHFTFAYLWCLLLQCYQQFSRHCGSKAMLPYAENFYLSVLVLPVCHQLLLRLLHGAYQPGYDEGQSHQLAHIYTPLPVAECFLNTTT